MALARALVKRPKLLLLDEPLGALDRKLREHTQFELINIQQRLGVTFVVVTHDQEEAMTLATRIGVMNHGEIVQVGTPRQIYEFPSSNFVADFIGSVNMFEGRLIEDEPDYVRVACAGAAARGLRRSRHQRGAGCDRLGGGAAGEDPDVAQPPAGADNWSAAWSRRSPTWGTCRSTWSSCRPGKVVRVTQPNSRASRSASPGNSRCTCPGTRPAPSW